MLLRHTLRVYINHALGPYMTRTQIILHGSLVVSVVDYLSCLTEC